MASGKKGMLCECSRCKSWIFLQYICKGETDGGYTTWDKFEDLPEDWLYESEFGYLCPDCATEFKRIMTSFFMDNPKALAAKWRDGMGLL